MFFFGLGGTAWGSFGTLDEGIVDEIVIVAAHYVGSFSIPVADLSEFTVDVVNVNVNVFEVMLDIVLELKKILEDLACHLIF